MVNGQAGIGIGVHLCLVAEMPLLPKEQIPSLVDRRGYLPESYGHFFYKICRRRINFLEAEKELDAQIRKALDSGIVPTHLDSHQYIHLLPPIFNIAIRLAKKYNIRYIRYPKQDNYIPLACLGHYIKKIYLAFFARHQLNMLKENNIYCPDFSCGFIASGRLNERIIRNFLENLNAGRNDIICHPGYYPQNKKYAAWRYCWQRETNALNSEAIKDLIKKLNITLSNYAA